MSDALESGASSRCRVCLQHQDNILMLSNDVTVQDEKVSLGHILVSCSAVKIPDDDKKPQTVCTQCVQDAATAYKFKETVEQSDSTLQYELDNMINVKEEEIDVDEGEDMNIEGYPKTGTTAPIKDELTDCVSIPYNDDFNRLKIKPKTRKIELIACKICQTYFLNWTSLLYHLEDCYKLVCGRPLFTSIETLYKNAIITHESPSTYTKLSLKQRERCHKCRFCKRSYKFPAELRDHLMTHTTEKRRLCSYCGNKFSVSDHSKCEPTQAHHSQRHINKSDNKAMIASDSLKTKPRFGCLACNKSHDHKKSLMNHKCINSTKKPYKRSQCSKQFPSGSHHARARTDTGVKSYQCSHCSKRITKHYECSHCSKSFAVQGTSHERIDTGENSYGCSHCSKRFPVQGTSHERIDTDEKPYECSHCSKRFTLLQHLKPHERTHTGEKPYACSHCS